MCITHTRMCTCVCPFVSASSATLPNRRNGAHPACSQPGPLPGRLSPPHKRSRLRTYLQPPEATPVCWSWGPLCPHVRKSRQDRLLEGRQGGGGPASETWVCDFLPRGTPGSSSSRQEPGAPSSSFICFCSSIEAPRAQRLQLRALRSPRVLTSLREPPAWPLGDSVPQNWG